MPPKPRARHYDDSSALNYANIRNNEAINPPTGSKVHLQDNSIAMDARPKKKSSKLPLDNDDLDQDADQETRYDIPDAQSPNYHHQPLHQPHQLTPGKAPPLPRYMPHKVVPRPHHEDGYYIIHVFPLSVLILVFLALACGGIFRFTNACKPLKVILKAREKRRRKTLDKMYDDDLRLMEGGSYSSSSSYSTPQPYYSSPLTNPSSPPTVHNSSIPPPITTPYNHYYATSATTSPRKTSPSNNLHSRKGGNALPRPHQQQQGFRQQVSPPLPPPPSPPPPSPPSSPSQHTSTIAYSDLTILKMIGGGGFGQVWEATYRNTPVAVKVLTNSCQTDTIKEEVRMKINIFHTPLCTHSLHTVNYH